MTFQRFVVIYHNDVAVEGKKVVNQIFWAQIKNEYQTSDRIFPEPWSLLAKAFMVEADKVCTVVVHEL